MAFCLTCSLGNGLLVLVVLGAGRLVFGTLEWFVRPRTRGYLLMLGVGAALALTVELAALTAGRWQYEPAMPLLPVARVGLFPVLQMLLLPVIIFRVVAAVRFSRISEGR